MHNFLFLHYFHGRLLPCLLYTSGALQAATLLIRDKCDVLIHVNADVPKSIPAYDRIRAFEDTCQEYHVPYELNLNVIGDSYQDIFAQMKHIFSDIDEKYPDKKKGIFLANDTYANMFLNLIFQKYGCFPDSYELVGFDNSPIASEAILPITTVGQDVYKRQVPDHITPVPWHLPWSPRAVCG